MQISFCRIFICNIDLIFFSNLFHFQCAWYNNCRVEKSLYIPRIYLYDFWILYFDLNAFLLDSERPLKKIEYYTSTSTKRIKIVVLDSHSERATFIYIGWLIAHTARSKSFVMQFLVYNKCTMYTPPHSTCYIEIVILGRVDCR